MKLNQLVENLKDSRKYRAKLLNNISNQCNA